MIPAHTLAHSRARRMVQSLLFSIASRPQKQQTSTTPLPGVFIPPNRPPPHLVLPVGVLYIRTAPHHTTSRARGDDGGLPPRMHDSDGMGVWGLGRSPSRSPAAGAENFGQQPRMLRFLCSKLSFIFHSGTRTTRSLLPPTLQLCAQLQSACAL